MSTKSSNINWPLHLAFVALEVLNGNDGTMELSDLLGEIKKLDNGETIFPARTATYKNGSVIWEMRMQFAADIFVKAGFLRKSKGVWYLTDDGKKRIESEDKEAIINFAKEKSDKYWREKKEKQLQVFNDGVDDAEDLNLTDNTESYKSYAILGIKNYIRDMEPYPFQDLCAALLRGMGYYVRDNATPGPDGGIDIIAYTDPLGGHPPRIKVQVKHKDSTKTGIQELRELAGLLTKGDMGVFISSAGFASTCRDFARQNERHLELIDLDRLIDLWKSHYDKLSEEDKALLPLYPIYFLDTKRAISE